MNAKQFLSEFGHIANAPRGIKRLRELILELAITGNLVQATGTFESASNFLQDIALHREKLIAEGKIRRQVPFPAIKDEELSFTLPAGWSFERLGNVCEIVRGVTFPASQKYTIASDNTVVCLRTTNVQSEVEWHDLIYIDQKMVGRDDQWIQQGDTLISMANSYELVGKVALVSELKQQATFGGFLAAIRPHLLSPEYIYLVLRSPYLQTRMRATASQTTNIANISLAGMRPIPVPIPPREQQFSIVAKVDELMALCNKLETQHQRRRSQQNKLRLTTLQAVATSSSSHELQTAWTRLTDNFGQLFHAPNDLLDLRQCIKRLALGGLLSNQNDGEAISPDLKNAAITSSHPVTEAHMDWEIPNQWIWARTGWLGEARLGKMLDASKNKGELLPYLRNINVRWRKFQLTDVLTMRVEPHELPKISVKQGDLVICEGGEPGRSAIWREPRDFVIQKALHRFRCGNDVLPEYMLLCLEHDYFSGRLSRYYTGATIKHLTGRSLSEYAIPLPPIAEQFRIVKRVDELMLQCDQLEHQLGSALQIADRLAISTIACITGITVEQEEKQLLKTPKTELIASLRLGIPPNTKEQAPLAVILAHQNEDITAKDLWQRFGGDIDAFYAQLKLEIGKGWIKEPTDGRMRETEAG